MVLGTRYNAKVITILSVVKLIVVNCYTRVKKKSDQQQNSVFNEES